MNCPNCQKDIPSIAHLCPNCGEPVSPELINQNSGKEIEQKLKAAEQEIREELPLVQQEKETQQAPQQSRPSMEVTEEQAVGDAPEIKAPQFEAPKFNAPGQDAQQTPPPPPPPAGGGISFNVEQETVQQTPDQQQAPQAQAPQQEPQAPAPMAPAAPADDSSKEELEKLKGQVKDLEGELKKKGEEAPVFLQTNIQGQAEEAAAKQGEGPEKTEFKEASGITKGEKAGVTAADQKGEKLKLSADKKEEEKATDKIKAEAGKVRPHRRIGLIVASAFVVILLAVAVYFLSGIFTDGGEQVVAPNIQSKLDFIPEGANKVIMFSSNKRLNEDFTLEDALSKHAKDGLSENTYLLEFAKALQRPVAIANIPVAGTDSWVLVAEYVDEERAGQEIETWLSMQEAKAESIKLNKQKSYKISGGLNNISLTNFNGYILAAQQDEGLLELISRGQSSEYRRLSSLALWNRKNEILGEDAVFSVMLNLQTPGIINDELEMLGISENEFKKSKMGTWNYLSINYLNGPEQSVVIKPIISAVSTSRSWMNDGFTPILVEYIPADSKLVYGGSDLRSAMKELKKLYDKEYENFNQPYEDKLNMDLVSDVANWISDEYFIAYNDEGHVYALLKKTDPEDVEKGLNNLEKIVGSMHLEPVPGKYRLMESITSDGTIGFDWEKLLEAASFAVTQYKGTEIRFLDQEGTSFYYSMPGDMVAVSNELEGLQTLLDTINNSAPKLVLSPEFNDWLDSLPKDKKLTTYLYAYPEVYNSLSLPFKLMPIPQNIKRGVYTAYMAAGDNMIWGEFSSAKEPSLMHATSEETGPSWEMMEDTMPVEEMLPSESVNGETKDMEMETTQPTELMEDELTEESLKQMEDKYQDELENNEIEDGLLDEDLLIEGDMEENGMFFPGAN